MLEKNEDDRVDSNQLYKELLVIDLFMSFTFFNFQIS